jgi:hypothetical protein
MQTKEALKNYRRQPEQTVKDAWLVNRFTCQRMQDWRQAPEGPRAASAYDCYALKGCYVFKVVQDAQYRRLAAIKSPDWVQAMAHLINSKKPDVFRWHDSGDVQDLDHLQKIYKVCQLTPGKRHWMPTREAWIKDHLQDKPNNLVIRFSAPMVNQRAPASWPNSSEVVDSGASCPAAKQNNECRDCRACWDPKIKTVSYGKH